MLTEKSTALNEKKASTNKNIGWIRWTILITLFQASQYLLANLQIPELEDSKRYADPIVASGPVTSDLTDYNIPQYELAVQDELSGVHGYHTVYFQQAPDSKGILRYFPEHF